MADSPRIEELRRRVQGDPTSIAFAALAEEYRRAERYQEAIETCAAGLLRHPSYLSAHVTLGRALMEVGRLQEAKQELEFVLKLAPENLAAIRGLAEIHHRLGDEQGHPAIVPAPPAAAALQQAAERISVAEVRAASGAAIVAVVPAPPREDVTLPALEQLLTAIQRARAARVAVR